MSCAVCEAVTQFVPGAGMLGTTLGLRCRPCALRLPLPSLTRRTPICTLPAHSVLRASLAATCRRTSGTASVPSSCPLRATAVVRPGACLFARSTPTVIPPCGELGTTAAAECAPCGDADGGGGGMALEQFTERCESKTRGRGCAMRPLSRRTATKQTTVEHREGHWRTRW